MSKTKYIPSQAATNSPKLITGIGDDLRGVGWGGDYKVFQKGKLVKTFKAEVSKDTDDYFDGIGSNAAKGLKAIAVLTNPADDEQAKKVEEAQKRAAIVNKLKGQELIDYVIDNELAIEVDTLKDDKSLRAAIINYQL